MRLWWVFDEETPLEETLGAYASLIEQVKVRAIGASNYTAPRLKKALETSAKLGLPRYEALQPHYNLVERAIFETDLEPLCRAENVGVINYYALASGFLTGKYRSEADLSKSPRGAGVKKYLDARGQAILKALDDVAASHAATPGRVAIAWLIARPSVTAPNRQHDQRRSAAGSGEGGRAEAQARRNRGAEPGKRLGDRCTEAAGRVSLLASLPFRPNLETSCPFESRSIEAGATIGPVLGDADIFEISFQTRTDRNRQHA